MSLHQLDRVLYKYVDNPKIKIIIDPSENLVRVLTKKTNIEIERFNLFTPDTSSIDGVPVKLGSMVFSSAVEESTKKFVKDDSKSFDLFEYMLSESEAKGKNFISVKVSRVTFDNCLEYFNPDGSKFYIAYELYDGDYIPTYRISKGNVYRL